MLILGGAARCRPTWARFCYNPTTMNDQYPLSFDESGGATASTWEWRGGEWSQQAGEARQTNGRPGRLSEARLPLPAMSAEISLEFQASEPLPRLPCAYGFLLDGEEGEVLSLELLPRPNESGTATALLSTGFADQRTELPVLLPDTFLIHISHRLWVQVAGRQASLDLEDVLHWDGLLPEPPTRLVLFTRGMAMTFRNIELRTLEP